MAKVARQTMPVKLSPSSAPAAEGSWLRWVNREAGEVEVATAILQSMFAGIATGAAQPGESLTMLVKGTVSVPAKSARAGRQPGYYWVKPTEADGWEVAEWDADYGAWYTAGCESAIYDSAMAEIDERRLEREP